MRGSIGLLFAAAMLAGCSGLPQPAMEKILVGSDAVTAPPGTPFAQIPAPAMFMKVYPQRARGLDLEGRVLLGCTIRNDDRLHDCHVLSEPYADVGFGEAALKLAARYRVRRGALVPGPAVLPIAFRLSD